MKSAADLHRLDAAQSKDIVQHFPELGRSRRADPRVVAVVVQDDQESAQVAALLQVALPALQQATSTSSRLIDTLLPPSSAIVTDASLVQVKWNVEFRVAVAEEFGLLTAAAVAKNADSVATNSSALAGSWRKTGRVFSVLYQRSEVYPGFQFDDNGQPLPIVANLLGVLGRLPGWELTGWMTAPAARLGGERPVDVWAADPDAVLSAARALAAELDSATADEPPSSAT